MANDNPAWGEERIAAELLLKVGIRISPRTVRRYMPKDRGPRRGLSSQRWMTFVRNHAEGILACDFFVTVTASFRVLYVFVIMEVRWAHARSLTSTSQLIPRRTGHFSSFARSSLESNLIGFSSTTATAFTLPRRFGRGGNGLEHSQNAIPSAPGECILRTVSGEHSA